jgi:hypothetical protein
MFFAGSSPIGLAPRRGLLSLQLCSIRPPTRKHLYKSPLNFHNLRTNSKKVIVPQTLRAMVHKLL